MHDSPLPPLLRRHLAGCAMVFVLLLVLQVATLVLKFGFGHDPARGFVRMFSFDREYNVPTVFSVFLLAQASLLCAITARRVREAPDRTWLALAAIFAFLAADEYFWLHERLIEPVRAALSTSGFFYFAWIIPYGGLLLLLAVALWPWLRRLPEDTRRGLLAAACVYVSGALVLEGLGGLYFDGDHARRDLIYDLITTTEESCEMLGLLIFAHVMVRHLGRRTPSAS